MPHRPPRATTPRCHSQPDLKATRGSSTQQGYGSTGDLFVPIPDPTYLTSDGESGRWEVINCALLDCRTYDPHAAYPRVGQWVEHYLKYWEALRSGTEGATARCVECGSTDSLLERGEDGQLRCLRRKGRRASSSLGEPTRSLTFGEALAEVQQVWRNDPDREDVPGEPTRCGCVGRCQELGAEAGAECALLRWCFADDT